jgi:ubiquinone/menaquinone biosynthesis C-methylase UbiE
LIQPLEFGSLVRRDEVARLIGPYVKSQLQEHSREWRAITERLSDHLANRERKAKHELTEGEDARARGRPRAPKWYTAAVALRERFLRRQSKPADQSAGRLQLGVQKRTVKDIYEQRWGGRDGDAPLFSDSTAAFEWGDDRLVMQSAAIKRVYLLYLYRLITRLSPKSVLEIGCGNGINVALLANRFPSIAFRGVELTAAGVDQCRRLSAGALPPALSDFSPEPLLSDKAHRDVEFDQGDAAQLPYATGAFDLVITILALEQMEKIGDSALTEVARVSREHAVMIEPFRDWNMAGLRQRYVRSHSYFSAAVGELERYGLAPVFLGTEFPSKVTLGVGVVLARKAAVH